MTNPPTPNLLDWRERQYVSQFSSDILGLSVMRSGAPADVDDPPGTVVATITSDLDGSTLATITANHISTGLYEAPLTSVQTQTPGNYTVTWTYTMDGIVEHYETFIAIGESNPAYDALDPTMKAVVDSVWVRFADLYDSPYGGPNLTTYFQSHFSRGRVAQLLRIAIGRLNTMAQPFQTFAVDEPGQFPVAQWGSLLETALYVETLKHLVRSYTEQPAFVGGSVTRLDRRDYTDRWRAILQDEEAVLTSQRDVFKISAMSLGKPRVLVGGGVFGRFGPTRIAGSAAARPRYFTRFY